MPSSTRPPLIWSTLATLIASGPGSRKVALVIIVPSRIVLVSRASPASVTQASLGPGSPSVPIAEVVVGAEERPEAEPLGLQGDREQVVVRRALLGFGEDPQLHAPTLSRARRSASVEMVGERAPRVRTARSASGRAGRWRRCRRGGSPRGCRRAGAGSRRARGTASGAAAAMLRTSRTGLYVDRSVSSIDSSGRDDDQAEQADAHDPEAPAPHPLGAADGAVGVERDRLVLGLLERVPQQDRADLGVAEQRLGRRLA